MILPTFKLPSWIESSTLLNVYLPPIAWAVVIFLFSSQSSLPSLSFSLPDFLLKKTAHLVVYTVLFFLVHRSLVIKKVATASAWKAAFAITLIYALTDELHQTFVPGRYGTLRDIGYDMLGAALAFLWKHRYI